MEKSLAARSTRQTSVQRRLLSMEHKFERRNERRLFSFATVSFYSAENFIFTTFSRYFHEARRGNATAVLSTSTAYDVEKENRGWWWNAEGTSRESKRKVALSLSFATAFGQRISRLRRGGESRSEPR